MVRNGGPAFRHAGATAACSNNPMPRSLREQGCALPYVNCASQGICRNAKRRLSEPPSASVTKRQSGSYGAPVHLSHAGPDQGLLRRQEGAGERPPLLLSGRQDRRARAERLGQVDAAPKIMAGLDKEFSGEAWAAEGARVGYLPQEPELDPSLGREGQRHARRRGKAGDPRPLQRADGELLRRDGGGSLKTAGRDRLEKPLGPGIEGRDVDGGARLPAGRCRRDDAFRRREAPRGALQAAARRARPAAPRRADQPPRRGDRRVARKASGAFSRRRADRHPRPLFPRQRHRLDSGARSRPRRSLRRELHRLSRQEGEAAARRRRARTRARQKVIEREREWMGRSPEARRAKSKARIKAYDEL